MSLTYSVRNMVISPVARLTTIHVLLSLATSHDLLIHQMDVETTFPNGELEEKIYKTHHDGFIVKGQEDKVCKLVKYLHGLKKAHKQWHDKFDVTLISAGFSVNEADQCVYYYHSESQGVILCLYVDDILIFGISLDVINEVKTFLCQNFDIKDMSKTDVILNIKLIKGENEITLTQSHYVKKVLSHFRYKDSKPFDDDMPFLDTTASSWSDTKTSFKYSKLILIFFHQLF
jgi:hypothetical protein